MTQLGRRLATLGIVLMGITMLFFGRDIERALQPRCVAIVPLTLDKEAATEAVAAERSCQIAFDLRIASESVAEPPRGEAPTLRYCFPFACTALDASGKVLSSEQGELRWDQPTRIVRDESADASGGRARVQHNLPQFPTPSPASVRVTAKLAPDATYHAKLAQGELKLYDNLARRADEVVVAALVVLAGPAVMIVGVVLAIAGWLRARRQLEEEGDTRTHTD